MMGVRFGLVVVALLGLLRSAEAHSWYPMECCNGDSNMGDCHPVACDELVEVKGGIEWHHFTFTGQQIRASKDKLCHVCATENKYGTRGYCVFINPGS